MHAKNNRINSDFQLAYFVAGSCHTADGAYALLCAQREIIATTIKASAAGRLRQQAARLRAEQKLRSWNRATRLEGEADIVEMDAHEAMNDNNYAGAVAELATIERCIESIQPSRKYSHLPDPQAFEAAQQEEWKLELIFRAQNNLLTIGHISAADFAIMRMHPEFKNGILPEINRLCLLVSTQEGREKISDSISTRPKITNTA